MSEIQLAHFSWGETPDRSRIHEVALRDARIATEHMADGASPATRAGRLDRLGLGRLRLAFAGGPAIAADPCNCPA